MAAGLSGHSFPVGRRRYRSGMASRRRRRPRARRADDPEPVAPDPGADAAATAGPEAGIPGDTLPGDAHPGDALPEDLDVTAYVGPYVFPNIRRRRLAAVLYVVVALACALGYGGTGNVGLLTGAIFLTVVALYHWVAGWNLGVDQTEALTVATRTVGFPIGHASAQLAWRGWLSRPTWRVLVYSADAPPSMRGLVELDAVDGTPLGEYTEANPEDWSDYTDG